MNYSVRIIFILLILMTLTVAETMAESWQGITPLKSTRSDVLRILGKENDQGYYAHKQGKVRIFYGAGLKESDTCWGRASTDVVARIDVAIEYQFNLKQSHIDLGKFEKTVNSHHPGLVQYTDWKRGISYSVDSEDDEVSSIYYYPSQTDCNGF